ncbi:MAG TPA: hypothetical protein VGP68_15430 [Gemmataceae bacterium]|nr:hypothetical protein [Gemmataceae bacterium]
MRLCVDEFVNVHLFGGNPLSHIVSIQTKIHDATAVGAACSRLKLAAPVHGKVQLFEGEAEGLLIQLPAWQFPAVIDTITGMMRYDNYGGAWGEQAHLDKFIQAYAVEKCRLEARKKGYSVSEQALQDGSVRLQILEGVAG